MSAQDLIVAKKELRKLQKNLGRELAKGKFKETIAISDFKHQIKAKKLQIGDITKAMILQLSVE